MYFHKTLIKHFNFHISFKWRLNVHACIMEINQSPLSLQPPLQKSYNEISVIQTIPFMHSCACKFLLHLITLQILYSDVHSHACMFLGGKGTCRHSPSHKYAWSHKCQISSPLIKCLC